MLEEVSILRRNKTSLLQTVNETETKLFKAVSHKQLLHSASASGNLKVVLLVLNNWPDMISFVDKLGNTPLHIAAKYGHIDVINELVDSKASFLVENHQKKIPLPNLLLAEQEIVGRISAQSVLRRLDKAVRFKETRYVTNRHGLVIKIGDSIVGTDMFETDVLSQVVKLSPERINDFLKHPVCKTFMKLKGQRARLFYTIDFVLYFFYVLFYTALCGESGVVSKSYDLICNDSAHLLNQSTQYPIWNANAELAGATIGLGFFYLGLNLLFVFFGFYQFVKHSGKTKTLRLRQVEMAKDSKQRLANAEYMAVSSSPIEDRDVWSELKYFESQTFEIENTEHFENFIYRIIFPVFCVGVHSVAIFTVVFPCPPVVDDFLAFSMLFLWGLMVSRLQVFPCAERYLLMLKPVLLNFTKLLFTYCPVFLGFSFAFTIIFKNQRLLSFPNVFMTVFAMMDGEFNIQELFRDEGTYLPVTAQIIYFLFVVALGIIIMNLWISLSLSDTKVLRKYAAAGQTKADVSKIRQVEEMGVFFENVLRISAISRQINLFERNSYPTMSVYSCSARNDQPEHNSKIRKMVDALLYKVGIVLYNTKFQGRFQVEDDLYATLENTAMKV